MKLKMTNGLFRIFFLISFAVMFTFAAAKPQTPLTCNVTRQPDGSFLYRLSRPPSSLQCGTCWEHQNKTVIARNYNFNPNLVQNLTSQFLISKDCHSYLHYTVDCFEVWNEAHCHINCSLPLDVKVHPPATVNSTLICLTESQCFPKLPFGLGVSGISLLVVCVLWVLWNWNICKCQRRRTAALYTRANADINMEDKGQHNS